MLPAILCCQPLPVPQCGFERTGEWDLFKPLHGVKADDRLERTPEEMGYKGKTPLSKLL